MYSSEDPIIVLIIPRRIKLSAQVKEGYLYLDVFSHDDYNRHVTHVLSHKLNVLCT